MAKQNGIKGDSTEELVNSKKMHDVVLGELQKGGRAGGLQGIELIQGVVLAEEEWTPQNVRMTIPNSRCGNTETLTVLQGLVTSAQKVNRKGILNKYQQLVDEAYGKS